MTADRLRGTELVGMAGGALLVAGVFLTSIAVAAAKRSSESERPRKPPGTI